LLPITLEQAMSAAISVSVGVGPRLVPPRSTGSSTTDFTSRTDISVRACVGQAPFTLVTTVVFSLMTTISPSR